jgi:hypothetical protein
MLYLHCGWPRTSTTSLQTALFTHKDQLAEAGVAYPDRWRSKTDLTHHGLSEMLRASLDSDRAFDDFKSFLDAHADQDVLFSAEDLTTWLISRKQQVAFVKLLDVAQEVMPTRCIWTLRRHDEVVRSLFLLRLESPSGMSPRERKPGAGSSLDERFAGLRKVEEAVDGDVVYVKYDRAGGHNVELLRAFGIDGPIAARIGRELTSGLRLHTGPSHKQAVALLNVEALSARAGVQLDEAGLRRAFRDGDFEFEQDWQCEVTDSTWQKNTHELALAAARKHGIAAYVEFFEDAEIGRSTSSLTDTKAITDADLGRLVAFLGKPVLLER